MTADATQNQAAPTMYRLPRGYVEPPILSPVFRTDADRVLLQQNVVWFCHLRWIVVGVLGVAVLAAYFPDLLAVLGVQLTYQWPLVTAFVLASLNIAYLTVIPAEHASLAQVRLHLWVQIVADLAVLSAVVHFLGSVETAAPFMYLFHIILACVFFPPRRSLIVAAIAIVLYGGWLAAESVGIAAPTTIVLGAPPRPAHFLGSPSFWGVHMIPLLAIWAIIWFLASWLAGALREREAELAITNVRLNASSEERARHMLQTTHQLKAPFAAIHANTQLLLTEVCGPLPKPACEIVGRIAARCEMLSQQIVEMLQLSNLRSVSQATLLPEPVDLAETVRASVARVEPTAHLRGITISADLEPVSIHVVGDHLRMLLDNLLANAVHYSYDGGTVEVACRRRSDRQAEVAIRDHGIGILPDKLPHIFDEFYRTREAVRHNQASTGLGLSIVRDAAHIAGIQVQVESDVHWGTRFSLAIPIHPADQGRKLWHTS